MANIKRILVPTDFSENADAVFEFVRETAANYNATVDLIHIVPLQHYFNTKDAGMSFEDEDRRLKFKSRLEAKLEALLNQEIPEPHRGETFVNQEERVSTGIVAQAQKEKYDLIMIASRGRGNSLFNRGSVTEKLIRLAYTPVLSVNKGYNPQIKNILVPTDSSKVSFEALPMALRVAAKNQAHIELLSVSRFDGVIESAGKRAYRYTDEEVKKHAFKALKEFVASNSSGISFAKPPEIEADSISLKIGEEPVSLSIKVVGGGSTHAAIVNYAHNHAQLVVMATHGRSKMKNLFIGSTTEKVFRQLKMPLITFKPAFLLK